MRRWISNSRVGSVEKGILIKKPQHRDSFVEAGGTDAAGEKLRVWGNSK